MGHYLTGISFMAKVLQQKLAGKNLPEAVDAAKISEFVNRTVSQTRDLARGLCPVELETNGLQAALLELAGSVEKLFNVSCRVECHQPVSIYDNANAVHLYRIPQEAVNNAIKHGKATELVITLHPTNEAMNLAIKDNGSGLPKSFSRTAGMGLRVMNYRAGMIGATINLESEARGGTLVSCSMPNNRQAKKRGPTSNSKKLAPVPA